MNDNNINIPVRSVQTFLRKISQTYDDITPVIPDGIFGKQTKDCVISFQNKFNMPTNGIVDNEVWDKIISVYDDIVSKEASPTYADIFPRNTNSIKAYDKNPAMYVIQAMLYNLASYFSNLPGVQITGTHDDSIAIVKDLQTIFVMDPTGEIDKKFWNKLCLLYSMFIAKHDG